MGNFISCALTIPLSQFTDVIVPLAFSNSFLSQQKHITLLETLFAWDISGNHLTFKKISFYHQILTLRHRVSLDFFQDTDKNLGCSKCFGEVSTDF